MGRQNWRWDQPPYGTVRCAYDKKNHVDFNGSIAATLNKTKQYLDQHQLDLPTIVEVRNLQEIEACFAFPWIHRLLLDNMSPEAKKTAV